MKLPIKFDFFNNSLTQNEISVSRSRSPSFHIFPTPHGVVEMIDLQSQNPPFSNITIVFTPGNPGVIQIYERFLKSLFKEFDEKVRVVGFGHLGHSRMDYNNKKTFTIDKQIDKTVYVLKKISESGAKNNEIILLGHSIGCFLNLNAMTKDPLLPVRSMINVFPVVCHLTLPLTLKVFSNWMVRKCASVVISKIIGPNTIGFVSNIASYSHSEAQIALNYSQNTSFVENVLLMGDSSIQYISNELSEEILETIQKFSQRSLFIYTPKDRYVSKKIIDYLNEVVEDKRFIIIPEECEVEHAFPINEKYSFVKNICAHEIRTNLLVSDIL